jgi:hypothetical protein
LFFEISEQEHLHLRAVGGDGFVDQVAQSIAEIQGEGAEESTQLRGEYSDSDAVDELVEKAPQGDQGHEEIARAGVDGLDGQADLQGSVVGLFKDTAGEIFEVGWGEGVGVVAVFEGVEVARRSASAPGTELSVAMGAAAGVTAHGPGTASGDFTVFLVRVSRHRRISE